MLPPLNSYSRPIQLMITCPKDGYSKVAWTPIDQRWRNVYWDKFTMAWRGQYSHYVVHPTHWLS